MSRIEVTLIHYEQRLSYLLTYKMPYLQCLQIRHFILFSYYMLASLTIFVLFFTIFSVCCGVGNG